MNAHLNELALRLDHVVRAVPGVRSLYSAEPTLVRSVRAITAAESIALVSVTEETGPDGLETLSIVASVGVSPEHQAPTTALTVSDAIRDALDPSIAAAASIHVRISRIAD